MCDMHRDPSNEGLFNVNNFTEAHVRRIMGPSGQEKALRLNTVFIGLIKLLYRMVSKLTKMAKDVGHF